MLNLLKKNSLVEYDTQGMLFHLIGLPKSNQNVFQITSILILHRSNTFSENPTNPFSQLQSIKRQNLLKNIQELIGLRKEVLSPRPEVYRKRNWSAFYGKLRFYRKWHNYPLPSHLFSLYLLAQRKPESKRYWNKVGDTLTPTSSPQLLLR